MKRLPVVFLVALGLTLVACGDDGGGGDAEAFCSDLETLSDEVADGDLADENGLEDTLDTANALAESAEEGEQLDAVNAVRGELEDATPDDAEETAEAIQDELGDFAEDCDIDEDDFAIAPTTTTEAPTTTVAPPTTGGGGETTTTQVDGEGIAVVARSAVPADVTDQATAQACFDGDFNACDSLFTSAAVPDQTYGDSCAGRIPTGSGQFCTSVFPGPQPPPEGITDTANAEACFGGDMNACDALLEGEGVDNEYGFFCGGRIDSTIADTDEFCVEIFGDTAFA